MLAPKEDAEQEQQQQQQQQQPDCLLLPGLMFIISKDKVTTTPDTTLDTSASYQKLFLSSICISLKYNGHSK